MGLRLSLLIWLCAAASVLLKEKGLGISSQPAPTQSCSLCACNFLDCSVERAHVTVDVNTPGRSDNQHLWLKVLDLTADRDGIAQPRSMSLSWAKHHRQHSASNCSAPLPWRLLVRVCARVLVGPSSCHPIRKASIPSRGIFDWMVQRRTH